MQYIFLTLMISKCSLRQILRGASTYLLLEINILHEVQVRFSPMDIASWLIEDKNKTVGWIDWCTQNVCEIKQKLNTKLGIF